MERRARSCDHDLAGRGGRHRSRSLEAAARAPARRPRRATASASGQRTVRYSAAGVIDDAPSAYRTKSFKTWSSLVFPDLIVGDVTAMYGGSMGAADPTVRADRAPARERLLAGRAGDLRGSDRDVARAPERHLRGFEPARDLAGLPSSLTLHDLRHAAASRLIRAGLDVVAVASVLGHEDANTTLRIC
jgi:hypothetical protein